MDDDAFPREKVLGYAVAFLYSVVVAALWIPAFALRRTGRFVRQVGVESWPRANGSITAGSVKVIHGWVVDYALGRLDYSYRVAGEYYAGSFTRQYPDEQCAWDFVDAHRDRPVVVRYKDDNAQASALLDTDQDATWAEGSGEGQFAMVWRHWRDELRGEQQRDTDDEGPQMDDQTVSSKDQVVR